MLRQRHLLLWLGLFALLLCGASEPAADRRSKGKGVGGDDDKRLSVGGGGLSKRMEGFLTWAAANGIQMQGRLEVRHTPGKGIGLFALRDFAPGETLLSCPYALLLSPESAKRSPVGALFAAEGLPGCDEGGTEDACTALLAMHLLQTYRNKSSEMAPWMRVLPRSLGTPVLWNEEKMKEIRGSNLEGIARGWQGHIAKVHAATVAPLLDKYGGKLPAKHFTLKEFTWAYMTVFGRAFDVDVPWGPGGGGRSRVMGPLIDLFNHDSEVKSSYRFDVGRRSFDMTTQTGIGAGGEAVINYDRKNNADYLLQYGFVLQDNPYDYVGVMASIGPDAPGYAQKEKLLRSMGLSMGHRHRLALTGLPQESIAGLRVLCADPGEPARRAASPPRRRVSRANEECVHETLVSALSQMLSLYPTTLVDDNALDVPPRGGGDWGNAVVLRRGEKRILIVNLQRFRKRLRELQEEEEGDEGGDEGEL